MRDAGTSRARGGAVERHAAAGAAATGNAPPRGVPGGGAGLRLASIVVFLLSWQLAAAVLQSATLPTPGAVFQRLLAEVASFALPRHLGITLSRVGVSFLLAMAIGTVIGIAMGQWRRLDMFLDTWLVLGLNIPALVTIILCYVWFGLNDWAAIVAVAINKIPTVVVTVREGARAVDPHLMQVAAAYRLPRWRTLGRVYLPQLHPYLMAAARAGLSLIWKIVLVVELLGRSNGIGFQLNVFFQFFDIAGILAYTLVFAAVVLLIEALLLRPLERRLTAWRG
ncbi:ABC transporter permease [Thauera sinica]|nr:ABC transporter permease [Thauera sp. K11]